MIRVAAGILTNRQGEVLVAERNGGGPFNGMWEFPGGKIRPAESAEQALNRELTEEIGIEVTASNLLVTLTHHYEDRSVELHFFDVLSWRGDPRSLEQQQIRWLRPAEIQKISILPADIPVVDLLIQRSRNFQ